jgi:hypothetical protein
MVHAVPCVRALRRPVRGVVLVRAVVFLRSRRSRRWAVPGMAAVPGVIALRCAARHALGDHAALAVARLLRHGRHGFHCARRTVLRLAAVLVCAMLVGAVVVGVLVALLRAHGLSPISPLGVGCPDHRPFCLVVEGALV